MGGVDVGVVEAGAVLPAGAPRRLLVRREHQSRTQCLEPGQFAGEIPMAWRKTKTVANLFLASSLARFSASLKAASLMSLHWRRGAAGRQSASLTCRAVQSKGTKS